MLTLPQKILCLNCRTILYEGIELESPIEVIQKNNGNCPVCGKRLDYKYDNLKIIPR